MLGSKEARAKYISTVLADSQRPFIWEYFRPGTIPLAGERGYYDEVWPTDLTGQQQLTNFMVETKGTIPIYTRTPRVLYLLHRIWDPITNSLR